MAEERLLHRGRARDAGIDVTLQLLQVLAAGLEEVLEPRDPPVIEVGEGRLRRIGRDTRKVVPGVSPGPEAEDRVADHVHRARAVHGEATNEVVAASAKEGRSHHVRQTGAQLGDEALHAGPDQVRRSPGESREIPRPRRARDVHVPRAVEPEGHDDVEVAATEERRGLDRAEARIEPGHEAFLEVRERSGVGGIGRAGSDAREVGGVGRARDIDATRGVDRDGVRRVARAAAEEGRGQDVAEAGVELHDEALAVGERGVRGARPGAHPREVGRRRRPCHEDASGTVERDSARVLVIRPPEVGRVDGGQARVQPRDERVGKPVQAVVGRRRVDARRVRRPRVAGDVEVPGAVEGHRLDHVVAAAAEERGDENDAQVGIQLRHEAVEVRERDERIRYACPDAGEVRRRRVAGDVDVPPAILDDRHDGVAHRAAEERGLEHGIDDEPPAPIVGAEAEAVPLAVHDVRDVDRLSLPRSLLKRDRSGESDRSLGDGDVELALWRDRDASTACHRDPDPRGIRARLDVEELFHGRARGLELHVDARVDLAEADRVVGREVRAPRGRIVATEDVHFRRRLACAGHALHGAADKRFGEHDVTQGVRHLSGGRDEHRAVGDRRVELHGVVRLAPILDERNPRSGYRSAGRHARRIVVRDTGKGTDQAAP